MHSSDAGGGRVLVEYCDDGPDALGRRHFALTWYNGTRTQAQHFFADPCRYVVMDATSRSNHSNGR